MSAPDNKPRIGQVRPNPANARKRADETLERMRAVTANPADDKSAPDRPTVPQVLPLVQALYRRHAAGCCLHVMLDDYNTDAGSAQWCLENAEHDDCRELAGLLVQMTETQRRKIARACHD